MKKTAKPSFGPRTFEKLGDILRTYPHEAFRLFVACAACALAAGQREEDYRHLVAPYKPAQIQALSETFAEFVAAAELNDFRDVMGPVHMELGSKSAQQSNGEFYTPYEVCRMMAKLTLTDVTIPVDRPLLIQEPCTGAGQMVLCAAEELISIRGLCSSLNIYVEAWDVSPLACDMSFINFTLHGIPAEVVHGNSLSYEVFARRRNIFYPLATGLAQPHELAALNIMRQASAIATLVPETDPLAPAAVIAAPDIILDRKGQVLMDI